MCLSYAWQYKCGCIAPKPSNNHIYRCATWERRRSCKTEQLFSYLDVDCNVSCHLDEGDDRGRGQKEDWYLQNGSYQGEPSEEEYYFHRVPPQLMEPIFARKARKRRANAAPKEALEILEDQGIVVREVEKSIEASDGEEANSDIIVDESKLENYGSRALCSGRFTRKK